jgi:hypothetical protein
MSKCCIVIFYDDFDLGPEGAFIAVGYAIKIFYPDLIQLQVIKYVIYCLKYYLNIVVCQFMSHVLFDKHI